MKARLPQGYGGGQGNMIKQAQKVQEQITKLQEELEEKEFTATSGGDAVTVVMYGKKEIKTIDIKPEVCDPEDTEMLGDLVAVAVNECLKKIEEYSASSMEAATGGFSFPGLL